jgi:hypothetical protein
LTKAEDSSTRAVRIPDDLVARADDALRTLRVNRSLCPGWRLSRAAVVQVAVALGLDEIERRIKRGERI